MKKLLFFLLVTVHGFSQTVALQDLIALRVKSPQEIKLHCIDTGWQLTDERFSEQRNMGDLSLVSTQAQPPMQLAVFYGLDKPSQTRLILKLKGKDQFTSLKSGLAATDLKFASTEVAGNITTTTFKSEKVTLTIRADKPVGAAVNYEISVVSNDYDPKMYNFSLGK